MSPTSTKTDNGADAFAVDDPESDAAAEAAVNAKYPEGAATSDGVDDQGDAVSYEMGATLQDVKISAARNGANYEVTFEVGIENLDNLGAAARDGHDVWWQGIRIGAGGAIRRFAVTRDADDALHLKVVLHFSESEISKSVGKIGPKVAQHGLLKITPMQLSLDLTKRAE